MKSNHTDINERDRTDIMSAAPTQPASAGRPTDLQKDEAILIAARELLFHKGPGAVTIEAVARKAGISKVTVYTRHSNRDDLISAVIRSQAEAFSAHLPLPQASLAGVRDALFNFSLSVLHFIASPEHLQFMRIVGASINVPQAILQDIYTQGADATLQQLQHWLTELHRSQLIDCSAPAQSAELLLGMLLRLDVVRTQFGVSIQRTPDELAAHTRFAVDGFLKMHARPAT